MAAFQLALGVTTEALKERAHSLEDSIQEMCTDFERLESLMYGTGTYWLGEAGEAYRRDYEERKNAVSQLEEQMKTYPEKLLQIAGIYESAEDFNTNEASSLGNDLHLV